MKLKRLNGIDKQIDKQSCTETVIAFVKFEYTFFDKETKAKWIISWRGH